MYGFLGRGQHKTLYLPRLSERFPLYTQFKQIQAPLACTPISPFQFLPAAPCPSSFSLLYADPSIQSLDPHYQPITFLVTQLEVQRPGIGVYCVELADGVTSILRVLND